MSFEALRSEVRQITLDLPPAVSSKIGVEILSQVVGRQGPRVPFTLVYKHEGLKAACDKLYLTMSTPDPTSRVPDPYTDAIKSRLMQALDDHFNPGHPDRRTAAVALVTASREEPFSPLRFEIYEDQARLFPHYADKWLDILEWQFGIPEGQGRESCTFPFSELNDRGIRLANEYGPFGATIEQVHKGLLDQFQALEEHGPEIIEHWNRIREERQFEKYRRRAYALRGLSYQGIAG